MWAAVALRGISKKMKVAAAQRVVVSLRAQQCSLVGDHLDGSFCSSMAAAGTHLPAHLPPLTEELGGCMVMGRCLWAGWRGVAYTNVDTARRMRGSFSASDQSFVSCERVEVPISCSGHFPSGSPRQCHAPGPQGVPRTGPGPIKGRLSVNNLQHPS